MDPKETEFAIFATEPQAQITEYVAIYRVIKEEMDAWKAKADACKAELLPLIAEHGNYSDEHGYAQLVEPSERIKYDTKSLDALAASVPEVEEILKPHRYVTQGKPYLKVK